MLDGWYKIDPPTIKQLPVEADVPELLAAAGESDRATILDAALGDLTLIAFYYLLRVGEYTIKGSRNETKQTKQFKIEDVTFFKNNKRGQPRQLARNATDDEIQKADSATLKLDNQKNGWKNVCIHQERNFERYLCPVRALGRRYIHIRNNTSDKKVFLSAYFAKEGRRDVTDVNIRDGLKIAADLLDYPAARGIPIDRINTHSLRSGGANALSLAGFSDRHIQKMGRWKSATFMEYIREELHVFSKGMTTSMKRKFNFVNVAGGAYHDVTNAVMVMEEAPTANAA